MGTNDPRAKLPENVMLEPEQEVLGKDPVREKIERERPTEQASEMTEDEALKILKEHQLPITEFICPECRRGIPVYLDGLGNLRCRPEDVRRHLRCMKRIL